MSELNIREVAPGDPELAYLIGKLDEDLRARYPHETIYGVDFGDPKVRKMTFVVARADGQPVGCGGIRPLDGSQAELKRFFVDLAYRGSGIAKEMLDALENAARRRGFADLLLETGVRQPEAIRFYEKNGYHRIEPFGEYAGDELSVCYRKTL
ncbi:GNAT family N-acetyltransferase [Cohnella candidum]|uniref:GNAT family N-acetyltransferase n=1 Tax=Cohnella candidum TaxID=2674991 RepID=A0A3G3K5E0_9BACL|nr:GNAT family N-acetyltransferase [Cohnella candidum]AYQ75713.1 GNAT family N-acetyltransferase [Cohnella candidum]